MHSTSFDSPDSAVIRTGRDGRLCFSPGQRRDLLDAHARSGLSAMAFASLHGVKYQTFIAWLRKRREQDPSPGLSGPAFAEVLMDRAGAISASPALRVVLPCGASIEIPSREALPLAIDLLSALRRPC